MRRSVELRRLEAGSTFGWWRCWWGWLLQLVGAVGVAGGWVRAMKATGEFTLLHDVRDAQSVLCCGSSYYNLYR